MKPTIITLPKRLLDAAQKPDPNMDPRRRPITGALVDAAARRVVATNGLVMAMIPIPGDEPVVAGFISPDLWKAAKAKNAKGHYLDYGAGTLNGLPLEPPDHLGVYPPYGNAIPQHEPAYRFHLCPDLIAALAAAMGHDKHPLTLEFSADGTAPALVSMPGTASGPHPTGVFMAAQSRYGDATVGLLAARPQETSDMSDKSDTSDSSDSPRLNVQTLTAPSEIIPTLMRIAGELRTISNLETEAPRLIRDYLDLVPAADLDAQDEERDKEFADMEKAVEKADAQVESLRETIADRETRIDELTDEIDTLKEKYGDGPATVMPDAAVILLADLHRSQARVRELETQLEFQKSDFLRRINTFAAKVKDLEGKVADAMAAPPVKPLDKAPTAAPQKGPKEKPHVPMATRPPVVSHNAERNGIELRFDGKPGDATRESLKAHGWRWLPGQPGQPWAVRYSEEEWLFANHLANGDAYTPMPAAPPVIKAPVNLGFLDF